MTIYKSVEELIGHTPLVRLERSLKHIPVGRWLRQVYPQAKPAPLRSEILAKLEFFNPGGSVKDRIGRRMVMEAEKSGKLRPGGTIVEATSGNTGAGLAIMAATRGYRCVFVMPDKMSAEKINALRAFGAKVVITPTAVEPSDPSYYCNVAARIAQETPGAFLANQYFNPDNPQAHVDTTGPEIWEDTEGRLDLFVAGIGTGGTLTGTSRYLRSKKPDIKILAADPNGSIYAGLIREGKPSPAGRYWVEGIGEDMVPATMDLKAPDDCVTVFDDESFAATRMLVQREGLLLGGSCGTAFFAATQWLLRHEQQGGKPLRVVVLMPDSGSRYLSKIFNETWLEEKNSLMDWEGESLGGAVEFLPGTVRIQGV